MDKRTRKNFTPDKEKNSKNPNTKRNKSVLVENNKKHKKNDSSKLLGNKQARMVSVCSEKVRIYLCRNQILKKNLLKRKEG